MVVTTPIQTHLTVRVCVVTSCTDMVAWYHSGALLGGLLGPVESTKYTLARALMAVRDLTYEELRDRYTLEAGQVWTAGGMRIMIRDHYPALFRSMCKNANVHTLGNDAMWEGGSFTGGHALLRGTAGTGTSTFMFVMFIEFLKMLRAPSTEEVVKVDGVVVFNPAVTSIRIQWDGVYGGNSMVLRHGNAQMDPHRRVHLFDAGRDEPVRELPGNQGEGYFLATSSADPNHYRAWESKQLRLKKQYSVLWSAEELLHLIALKSNTVSISRQQLYDRYAVVGGVPRLILYQDASQLLETVQGRVEYITLDMVRTVMRNDAWGREALLHTGSGTDSFAMFAMDVKAEGDFDDVRVCHQAPLVNCGIGTRYSALDLYTLAGKVPHANSQSRVFCASYSRVGVEDGNRVIRCNRARSRPRRRLVRGHSGAQVVSRWLRRRDKRAPTREYEGCAGHYNAPSPMLGSLLCERRAPRARGGDGREESRHPHVHPGGTEQPACSCVVYLYHRRQADGRWPASGGGQAEAPECWRERGERAVRRDQWRASQMPGQRAQGSFGCARGSSGQLFQDRASICKCRPRGAAAEGGAYLAPYAGEAGDATGQATGQWGHHARHAHSKRPCRALCRRHRWGFMHVVSHGPETCSAAALRAARQREKRIKDRGGIPGFP